MTMDSKEDYHVKDNIFHGRDTKPSFDIKSERHLSSQWMRVFISRQNRSVKHQEKTSRYTKNKVSKSDVFVKKKRTIGTEQNLNHYLASKVKDIWAVSVWIVSAVVNTGLWHIKWILLGKLETQISAKTKFARKNIADQEEPELLIGTNSKKKDIKSVSVGVISSVVNIGLWNIISRNFSVH